MLTEMDIDRLMHWGRFPWTLRRFYIAQNGRCAYCGDRIALRPRIRPGEPLLRHIKVPSRDHVRPALRGKGVPGRLGNVVLSCAWCNHQKGSRQPYPCEVLFCEAVTEIVLSMLPREHWLR